ncbi:DNA methyltransferase [Ferrimicrobium sp.]|uniref:Eco57I restriction-modification methylase domain-containing protein n=1 Tax=Ferrimicrobium sp. TaxID=2926050 RepID=UPI002609D0C5|nr:DNA methyltransferase [Ferrimicrobium sp.]
MVSGRVSSADWLNLIQISGPFLTTPVIERYWPSGMPAVDRQRRNDLGFALNQMLQTGGATRADFIDLVLRELLGWTSALRMDQEIPVNLSETVPEYGVLLRASFAFFTENDEGDSSGVDLSYFTPQSDSAEGESPTDSDVNEDPEVADEDSVGPWRLLGLRIPWGQHPLVRTIENTWSASPVERLAVLLRTRDIPLGLVTDGRWWAVVWAPQGRAMGSAVWDASLWIEEPETLRGFVALLGRHRFLGVRTAEQLPALLEESSQAQEEITDQLGRQVRQAALMLVGRLDVLSRDSEDPFLDDVSDDDLYAGVVTVLMRILFLFFAEERRLLPSDNELYDRSYSISRLVEALEHRESLFGQQTLRYRTGAWHRILAISRALHVGVAHEDLRLIAYGGTLFDPDRFPWLEDIGGAPPPIDDATILAMLRAVQYVTVNGVRRQLSFRSLDVEQIGYVYEGLLELEVQTLDEPVLMLHQAARNALYSVPLNEVLAVLDRDRVDDERLFSWVVTRYLGARSVTETQIARAKRILDDHSRVNPATHSSLADQFGTDIASRLSPLVGLLKLDDRGAAVVLPKGARQVVPSYRRASTGAHYTPRSLAEEVVSHALEPLVYRPGPLETLDSSQWVLRPSSEILKLRVADIAMGSGAFLVATCRYLADRLVEARAQEGVLEALGQPQGAQAIADTEIPAIVLRARQEVAEHCIYGVDINPLATEMAKLSLWLLTMDQERPFGFLDDRIVCGDSLLGLSSMYQLEHLTLGSPDPYSTTELRLPLFDNNWQDRLELAADKRRQIAATPVLKVRDVEHKLHLIDEARSYVEEASLVADALVGAGLHAAVAANTAAKREAMLEPLRRSAPGVGWSVERLAPYTAYLNKGLPPNKEPRQPLHWPLAFPEIFADSGDPGFDAVVGNPPFLGGKKISGALGDDYLAWLVAWEGNGIKGSADLAARFVLRAEALLNSRGQLAFVSTNSLIEGGTLRAGLLQLERRGWKMRRATSEHPWPSKSANLSIIEVWLTRAPMKSEPVLDDEPVPRLTIDLQPYLSESGRPERLDENDGLAFQGSNILGLGFTMSEEEAQAMIRLDPRNKEVLFPFVIGKDLNQRPDSSASRWIINFREWDQMRAQQYSEPWAKVTRDVKPDRMRKDAVRYPRMVYEWWKFWQYRQGLEGAIASLDHVLAISRVGSVLLPVRLPTGQVFSEACVVFAFDDFASLALLSSNAHQSWVIRYTSTMRTDIRYAPTDVFLTFPRPSLTGDLELLGQMLDEERRKLMLKRSSGLTSLYNLVHDPTIHDPAIENLREIHRDIDLAVLAAYGWSDLDPEIGHHRTKIGIRWTFSLKTRNEVLDRLLRENHRRARR